MNRVISLGLYVGLLEVSLQLDNALGWLLLEPLSSLVEIHLYLQSLLPIHQVIVLNEVIELLLNRQEPSVKALITAPFYLGIEALALLNRLRP